MNFPEELKYTRDHEWIRVEGDEAIIGITEFAQSELGDIVFVDIDTVGNDINKDELFGSVEAVKTVSDLFMPVNATVLSVNAQLDVSPELVNTDPYGEGWMIRVKLNNPSDVETLMSANSYKELIGK